MKSWLKIALANTILVVGTSFVADQSHAQSNMCRQLKAELSSYSNNRGSSRNYRKYDRAVREQSVQISRTKNLARRSGCALRLFRSSNRQCERINASLKKMNANLSKLKRQRARHAPKNFGSSRSKQRIVRLLQANGCAGYAKSTRQVAKAAPAKKSRRRTLLEQVFGVGTYNEHNGRGGLDTVQRSNTGIGGTYRTLCVRESDGYYFPISFAVHRKHFNRDAHICQSMCPEMKVSLYHHRMPGEDSEQMVAFGTEQPYATQPFAFAYRKEIAENNSCRFASAELAAVQSLNQAKADAKNGGPAAVTQNIAVPFFRKDPHINPDSHDSSRVGFTHEQALKYLETIRNPKADVLIAEKPDENKVVRIVGPAFFPVQ